VSAPAPPAPTTIMAPPASDRFFAASSPLNTPIAANPAIDGNSPAMVQQLVTEANRGWAIGANEWTATIWYADATTPRHFVPLGLNPTGGTGIADVPIPANAAVTADADAEMIVVDRSTRCVYDFGRAAKRSDGTWGANFVNALSLDSSGIFPHANSNSASGFSYLAGKIRPEELAAGHIDHALVFAMSATKAGGPVAPATGSDGRSTLPGALPEGAHVQLDPNLNLDTLGLQPWQKTIARALQQYGMFLFDTGGSLALYAQGNLSTSVAYPWGTADYAYMPPALAQHLRVLELPQQFDATIGWRFMPNPCANYR
jgi:hypothetical protein